MPFNRHLAWLCALTAPVAVAAADPVAIVPDLKAAAALDGWEGRISTFVAGERDGVPTLRFSANRDDDFVWLKDFDFRNGVIELDIKGQSGPPQSNFIGVAFRVQDGAHYDTVYFRPFNFRAEDPERRAHAVQYTSHPDWTWKKLRSERTGEFEKPIAPAPDGDGWFHAKILVDKPKVSVFVNGASTPSLVVNELSDRVGGSVGIWGTGTGEVANLKITRSEP